MPNVIYTITLRGTDGETTSLTYDLGVEAVINMNLDTDVRERATEIKSKLVNITDAFVSEESFRIPFFQDNQIPPAADIFEEALVSVHLNPPAEAEKLHTLRVPAPKIGIFRAASGNERNVVNESSALLQQYVGALANYTLVSDGEQIFTSGHLNNGIKRGFRSIRKRKLGR